MKNENEIYGNLMILDNNKKQISIKSKFNLVEGNTKHTYLIINTKKFKLRAKISKPDAHMRAVT